jgi:hypothetical protein
MSVPVRAAQEAIAASRSQEVEVEAGHVFSAAVFIGIEGLPSSGMQMLAGAQDARGDLIGQLRGVLCRSAGNSAESPIREPRRVRTGWSAIQLEIEAECRFEREQPSGVLTIQRGRIVNEYLRNPVRWEWLLQHGVDNQALKWIWTRLGSKEAPIADELFENRVRARIAELYQGWHGSG